MAERVTLRRMTAEEFPAYREVLEAEVTRQLSAMIPEVDARLRAAEGTDRNLPHGVDTQAHHVLVAENANGDVVGTAWLGPDPYRPESAARWLYDISVRPQWRRRGYGAAILSAAEEHCRAEGADQLGLNVFGDNVTAISLYNRAGYGVAAQHMTKRL